MTSEKKTPATEQKTSVPDTVSSGGEIADFLQKMKTVTPAQMRGERGRLIFAMDATMSRQPTWDMALKLQADMFIQVEAVGGLGVQLVFFRSYDECGASQ